MNFISKSVLLSFFLAIVGYFVYPVFALNSVNSQILFAVALLGSGIVVSLVADNIEFPSSDDSSVVESDGEQQTLYVGNLAYRVSEGQVRDLFAEYGEVSSVRLMRDRKSGKRKGFGFVEMDKAGAKKAIKKLNDTEFAERNLKIREANERGERSDD